MINLHFGRIKSNGEIMKMLPDLLLLLPLKCRLSDFWIMPSIWGKKNKIKSSCFNLLLCTHVMHPLVHLFQCHSNLWHSYKTLPFFKEWFTLGAWKNLNSLAGFQRRHIQASSASNHNANNKWALKKQNQTKKTKQTSFSQLFDYVLKLHWLQVQFNLTLFI